MVKYIDKQYSGISEPPSPRQFRSYCVAVLLELTTMWQDSGSQYGAPPLQFYAPGPHHEQFYPAQSSLEGTGGSVTPSFGGSTGGWWTAFGTGGFDGEPPLLEGTSHKNNASLSIYS